MVAVDVVGDGPGGQLVPLGEVPSVDRNPGLEVLIFGILQIIEHLLDQVSKVFPIHEVVGFEKNLS